MGGDSIAQARVALDRIVDSLREQDFFSLIAFGSHFRNVLDGNAMLAATETNKQVARTLIRRLDADMGGTEIGTALEACYALRAPRKTQADVLLITDGNVFNHEQVVAKGRKSKHRVFTVGVGSSVTEVFVRELAEQTGGAFELVSPNEDMADKIHRHFLRMLAPACEKLDISWSTTPTCSFPDPVRAIYDGDTVHLFHWFDEQPTGEVKLALHLPDGQLTSQAIELGETEVAADDEAPAHSLARLAAATRIRGTQDEKVGAKVALDYQLMSPWTNCLVVDERPEGEKAEDLPALRKVKSMVSAGWGASGSIQRSMRSIPAMRDEAGAYDQVSRCEGGPTTYDEPAIRQRKRSASDDDMLSMPDFLRRVSRDGMEKGFWSIERWLDTNGCNPFSPPTLKQLHLEKEVQRALQQLIAQGMNEPMAVITFLYAAAREDQPARLERKHIRALRKLYREALVKSGADPKVVADKFKAAFQSVSFWNEVIERGLDKINQPTAEEMTE